MAKDTFSAFFYGTLLHPKILTRVIGNDGSHLQISPALLLDYTRHQVKSADYPAIVPYEKSREHLIKHGLPDEDRCVRGTLVKGLTSSDIEFLDLFEGNEYDRLLVSVTPLGSPTALPKEPENAIAPSQPPSIPARTSLPPGVPAHTYVWRAPIIYLTPEVWSFEQFIAQNAWKWVGKDADRNEDIMLVEERRAVIGEIVRTAGRGTEVRAEVI